MEKTTKEVPLQITFQNSAEGKPVKSEFLKELADSMQLMAYLGIVGAIELFLKTMPPMMRLKLKSKEYRERIELLLTGKGLSFSITESQEGR